MFVEALKYYSCENSINCIILDCQYETELLIVSPSIQHRRLDLSVVRHYLSLHLSYFL
jgi:hypothetical protein